MDHVHAVAVVRQGKNHVIVALEVVRLIALIAKASDQYRDHARNLEANLALYLDPNRHEEVAHDLQNDLQRMID